MSDRAPTVFISSTIRDLGAYRMAARDAALRSGFQPTLAEQFEAESSPAVGVDLDRVLELFGLGVGDDDPCRIACLDDHFIG